MMQKLDQRLSNSRRRRSFLAKVALASSIAASLSFGYVSNAWADGNPDIVGVLASITEPNVAADLELSDEQLGKLKDLVKQSEAKAIDPSNDWLKLQVR